ncbi:MAG: hydantoinase B/oxoprolinase family protein [Deltaproteobacteria bacterium]|nr:hydantoinase B/oxoprolinase family protein [Deltaproteobacteria bacterium]
MSEGRWQFFIDCGGTFTDCIGVSPAGRLSVGKVLSAGDAPVRAIEALLARAGDTTPPSELVCSVRLGTTVATNALLERSGVPTALVAPRGLAGVFDIGTQERPALFELEIHKPPRLHGWALEVAGRRSATGEAIEALDPESARRALAGARAEGAHAVAIAMLHAHLVTTEEEALAALAREVGFEDVVCSHACGREIGFLARGETAIADAYLTPRLREHTERLAAALPRAELRLMQSSGGLTSAARFRGPNALLSGPAGGVLATRAVAARAGRRRAIGFDMGGTSTDVSLVDGDRLERSFESVVGGVRVKAPMLRIHTVAAGGGSLCRFDGNRFTVGPESAGADPGPLCYARRDAKGALRARALTVTDANFALGRVLPDRFPFALEREGVERALASLQVEVARAGFARSPEEIAAGFVEIANAHMAQAIVEVCVSRGVDPRDHVLVGFGGAGGQHVCALARRLGIREILLHPLAGVLSAFGIGIARQTWHGEQDGGARTLPAAGGLEPEIEAVWSRLSRQGIEALRAEGEDEPALRFEASLDLGYVGTDTALEVLSPDGLGSKASRSAEAWREAFERLHRDRFGYVRPGRAVAIKAIRLRVAGPENAVAGAGPEAEPSVRIGAARHASAAEADAAARRETDVAAAVPLRSERVWFSGAGFVETPVHAREALAAGARLVGPALVLEASATVVLDPGFALEVDGEGVFRISALEASGAEGEAGAETGTSAPASGDPSTLRKSTPRTSEPGPPAPPADPVRLEILGSRFMSIAEQMGAVLRNTSVSTNIKERLDYSCAVFDREGGLVANAPHIPVHLGAMADTVAAVRRRFAPFIEGDVVVTNDPFEGGSHLPDVTVVSPVFLANGREPAFFVASRGHHADLGGAAPGSMPADSTRLAEEGVLIEAFLLVRAGRFDEARLRALLGSGPHPARRPDDNVADLEAMIAANRAGAARLAELVAEEGEAVVHATMGELQAAAAEMVARELAKLAPGRHAFEDALDDGTPIRVALDIVHRPPGSSDPLPARVTIDFEGTGPATRGNLNAPPSVVRAAVIYVLRSIVAARIPLNGGCLAPVELRIPADSLLDPPRGSAVAGGNVETSQRVVDVLLGALGRAAASQGTMNNVAFGDARFGYYETIGGGAGATPFADGASGVHTHMTNTRITDPEILETRFPVRLERFQLRSGSGGAGRFQGGEGVERRLCFLRPVRVSLLTQRRLRVPFGLAGGAPGAPGRNRLRRAATGEIETLAGQLELELSAGDALWIETPGGGGFGKASSSGAGGDDS